MQLPELTGDEHALLAALLTREILRQRESEKLDMNKRVPDYDAARSAARLAVRLQAILRKVNAAATATQPAASAATPSSSEVRPGR
jgi:hypothetical protein